ncbi:MAG TPA: hypothetical protein VG890_07530 [Puia sp.]|nr:hypothetical protein [Puia sp.]
MKRKTFIMVAVGTATAISVPFISLWYKKSQRRKHPLSYPLMLSLFCDETELRKIGTDYLKNNPTENSKEQLFALLQSEGSVKSGGPQNATAESHELQKKIRQDFESNRTITLQGWVISQTEARQCSLLSLS